MGKHKTSTDTLSEIIDKIIRDTDTRWDEVIQLDIPGLAEIDIALADARTQDDVDEEYRLLDQWEACIKQYIKDHGDDLYLVSWPDLVTYPRYNGDANYQPI